MITHTRFDDVKYRATKRCSCTRCDKIVRRSKTFSQTLNPFNKNKDGIPKNRGEILEDLVVEAKDWQITCEICTACIKLENSNA